MGMVFALIISIADSMQTIKIRIAYFIFSNPNYSEIRDLATDLHRHFSRASRSAKIVSSLRENR